MCTVCVHVSAHECMHTCLHACAEILCACALRNSYGWIDVSLYNACVTVQIELETLRIKEAGQQTLRKEQDASLNESLMEQLRVSVFVHLLRETRATARTSICSYFHTYTA